ncbi:hypothetical protein LCGC14_0793070 [marine sediment metagenome]|uniref:HNH nuclease domain-containing protein n=1 Tax=marine sediment metagenome TaxID=412755 RepID=A0A0F9QBV0_9ZZZZ
MVVSILDRGRDAVNVRPPDTERLVSMLTQSTTFGDARLPARFWDKVRIGAIPDYRPDLDPCWEWTGAIGFWGYGNFGNGRRNDGRCKTVRAHRWAYEHLVGPIPQGLELDHLCRNHACVNYLHIEAVTRRENLLRGDTFAAVNARKTHCLRGHPFNDENTYHRSDRRGRQCRICKSEASSREYYRHQMRRRRR